MQLEIIVQASDCVDTTCAKQARLAGSSIMCHDWQPTSFQQGVARHLCAYVTPHDPRFHCSCSRPPCNSLLLLWPPIQIQTGDEAALLNYEGLADLEAFLGNTTGARAVLTAGLTTRRPTPRFLRECAQFEKRTGDLDAASRLYAAAARRSPRDHKTWLQWGVLEKRRGRWEAAARCFERGVGVAPRHPHIWYVYAVMTWRSCGDVEGAAALFERAMERCPRSVALARHTGAGRVVVQCCCGHCMLWTALDCVDAPPNKAHMCYCQLAKGA